MKGRYSDITLRVLDDDFELQVGANPALMSIDNVDDLELATAMVFGSLASQESIHWWRDAVETIGEALYSLLFGKKWMRGFMIGVENAVEEGAICRIGLHFGDSTNEIAQKCAFLPWEFLYSRKGISGDSETGVFFGVNSNLALYRRIVDKTRKAREDYLYHGKRILVIRADVSDRVDVTTLIDKLKELGAVQRSFDEMAANDHPDGPDAEFCLLDNPDLELLRQAIGAEIEWNIIHFIGHAGFDHRPGSQAGGGKVAMVKSNSAVGTKDPPYEQTKVSAADFAAALSKPLVDGQERANTSTDLVVLHSCLGAAGDHDFWSGFRGVASSVAREGFPAVVAMQYRIDEETANEFACAFYDALFRGNPVDVAVQSGRLVLANPDAEDSFANRDFASPVLFSTGQEIVFFPKDLVEPEEEPEDRTAVNGTGRPAPTSQAAARPPGPRDAGKRTVRATGLDETTGSDQRRSTLPPPADRAVARSREEKVYDEDGNRQLRGRFDVESAQKAHEDDEE